MPDIPESPNAHAPHSSAPLQISSIGVLTQLLGISPDALVVLNQDGTIMMTNEQAEDLFGYARAELFGQPLEILLPRRFRKIHDSHREHYFSSPRTRPMGAGLQLFGLHKDGTEFPVDISLKPLLLDDVLHVLGAIRDVTQQRLAERERQKLAQHIRLQAELIEKAHDAIFVRDPIGRVLSWNQGAEKLYGWTAQEALGRLADTLLKTRFPVSRSTFDALLEQERQWEGELTHIRRDGSTVIVKSRQVLVRDEAGQPLAILEINRDITEQRHKAEVEQATYTETAERLLAIRQDMIALKEAEYLKDEFIGIATHELRTPLAVLAGYVDMLLRQTTRGHGPKLSDWQQEALSEIKQATARLTTLTEDLLDVTRLQAGRLVLQCAPTNMVPLVQQVATQMQQTTTRHQVEVRTTCPSLVANIDARRIEQVLTNLIGNAIKYSPQGGAITIALTEETAPPAVQISVQDRGIGIPKHQHAQIFGRFIRADNARAWGISGTGLGLYLCHELVEQQEGHLWFESEEGAGSTFFVTLPLVPADQVDGTLSP